MDDTAAAVTRVANKTTATRMPRDARARERGRASPAPSGRALPADTPLLLIAYRNDLCVFTRTSPSVGDLDIRSFNAASYTPGQRRMRHLHGLPENALTSHAR